MTNRFNFRYWDKTENMMRTYDIGLAADGTPFVVNDDINNPITCLDNIVIMQCTGLKDKNGKLIYEGDIVKETLTDFINEEIIIVVKWDKLNASYNLENLQNCEREVIGNIYENKSLLESEV